MRSKRMCRLAAERSGENRGGTGRKRLRENFGVLGAVNCDKFNARTLRLGSGGELARNFGICALLACVCVGNRGERKTKKKISQQPAAGAKEIRMLAALF